MNHLVTRAIELDAGHRVPLHHSKCRNPHGHRYKIEAGVSGPLVTTPHSDHGMVVDFGALKELMVEQIHERWDHAFLVWEQDRELRACLEGHDWRVVILELVPTAENLAFLVFHDLRPWVEKAWDGRVKLEMIRVWETPSCTALYSP
jgi:6-pyruvoyltetrahydropterin/6-carboxytetrahydropterin synthase